MTDSAGRTVILVDDLGVLTDHSFSQASNAVIRVSKKVS